MLAFQALLKCPPSVSLQEMEVCSSASSVCPPLWFGGVVRAMGLLCSPGRLSYSSALFSLAFCLFRVYGSNFLTKERAAEET